MGLYVAGINAAETLELNHDVSTLELKLKQYMMTFYKDVKYKDFYDKKFLDIIKCTIKQPEEFQKFLNYLEYDLDEFIKTSIYVCPSIFTTAVIKFIKVNYLKNDLENPNS